MAMQIQPYSDSNVELIYNQEYMEEILLKISDMFDIRIEWNEASIVLTSVMALAGGYFGGYAGGRLGAAIGAGIGGAAGVGVATVVALREVWEVIKEKVKVVFYIIYNYLRRLDPIDYVRAFEIIMACASSRKELVLTIVEFLAHQLGKGVYSNITD